MLEEKCMNKWMSEHRTNELLPPLGVWALRTATHFWYTCEHDAECNRILVPALLVWLLTQSLAKRPGRQRAWACWLRTILRLWVWWGVATAWYIRVADWHQRHRCVEIVLCWGHLGPTGCILWGWHHINLADEFCWILACCSLLCNASLSLGRTPGY